MALDINKICIKIDDAKGDEDLLKEIFDYVKSNQEDYSDSHYLFIREHLLKAVKETRKKYFNELINLA